MQRSSLGCDSRRRPPDRDPEERQPRLELVSGGHLNAPPLPSVDPDRLTCGVRVLTVFPPPPRGENGEKRWSRDDSGSLSRSLFCASFQMSGPTRIASTTRSSGISARRPSASTSTSLGAWSRNSASLSDGRRMQPTTGPIGRILFAHQARDTLRCPEAVAFNARPVTLDEERSHRGPRTGLRAAE